MQTRKILSSSGIFQKKSIFCSHIEQKLLLLQNNLQEHTQIIFAHLEKYQ